MKSIRQIDIARELGISQSAVAKVLNPGAKDRLSPKTRQRVLTAVNRLGYRPHQYARMMRNGKTGFVGILQFGGFSQVNDQRSLLTAKAVREQGYHPLINHVFWYLDNVQDAINMLLDIRVEGLLLMTPSECVPASFLDQIRDAEIQVVSLSGVSFPGLPQVRSDIRQGMFDLTNHLLGLGYRKLVLLTTRGLQNHDQNQDWPLLERVTGFQEAARQCQGGGVEAETICGDAPELGASEYLAGKIAMRQVLERPNRPEAVLCGNDNWAVGALMACVEAGLSVPRDIAITGCANDAIGDACTPPLTTLAQPLEATATKAVDMLTRKMRGEKLSAGEELVKLPCQLVVRQSCGASLREGSVMKNNAQPKPEGEHPENNQP